MPSDSVSSGLRPLDDAWGGLRTGAAYLLYGRAGAGRLPVALALAAGAEGTCVLVTARAPQDLAAAGRLLGLDVEAAVGRGRLRLLRPPASVAETTDDEALTGALADLARLVASTHPARLVVEDFTPFVRFRRFAALRDAVIAFLETLAQAEITTVLALGEPANDHSREIVAFLRGRTEGAIHVARAGTGEDVQLTLLPPPDSDTAAVVRTWTPQPEEPVEGATLPSLGDGTEGPPPIRLVVPEREPPPETPPSASPGPVITFFDLDDPLGTTRDVRFEPSSDFPALAGGRFVSGEAEAEEPEAEEPEAEERGPAPPSPSPVVSERPPQEPSVPPPLPSSAEDDLPEGITPLTPPAPPAIGPRPAPEPASAPANPRRDFTAAFDAAKSRADAPFVAVALRAPAPHPDAFAAVHEALRRAVGPDTPLLADAGRGRLAFLVRGGSAETARTVLRSLVGGLRGNEDAERLLRTAEVLVAPDGRSFASGEAFLARTFDAA